MPRRTLAHRKETQGTLSPPPRRLLRVPPAVVPHERNMLLDCRHPDAARARVAAVPGFAFDPRLL